MGRKKFIEKLTEAEREMLQEGLKHGRSMDFRHRCQMILLNDRGYEAQQIADILEVSLITVYHNLQSWQTHGIVGLIRKKGQGRKPRLSKSNAQHVQAVSQAVDQQAQKIELVLEELSEQLGIPAFSRWTLQRFLKKLTTSGNASEEDPDKNPAKGS